MVSTFLWITTWSRDTWVSGTGDQPAAPLTLWRSLFPITSLFPCTLMLYSQRNQRSGEHRECVFLHVTWVCHPCPTQLKLLRKHLVSTLERQCTPALKRASHAGRRANHWDLSGDDGKVWIGPILCNQFNAFGCWVRQIYCLQITRNTSGPNLSFTVGVLLPMTQLWNITSLSLKSKPQPCHRDTHSPSPRASPPHCSSSPPCSSNILHHSQWKLLFIFLCQLSSYSSGLYGLWDTGIHPNSL